MAPQFANEFRKLRATGDRIVPYGLSDLVDRLVSDGVPAGPVRLPWRCLAPLSVSGRCIRDGDA